MLVGTKIQVGFVADLIFPLRDDVMMNDDYEKIIKMMWYQIKNKKGKRILKKQDKDRMGKEVGGSRRKKMIKP